MYNYIFDQDDIQFWNEIAKYGYKYNLMNKIINTVKDDDSMKYSFPANDMYFIIDRTPNHFFVEGGPNFRVTITAYAIYGNTLFSIVTDEVNIARIVDNLEFFNFQLGGYGDSMSIELSPFDSNLSEFTYIYLERINYIEDLEVYDDPYDTIFEIRRYNKIYETMVTLYSTKMNTGSLDDLAYALFFVSLIDLDPEDYKNALNTDVTDEFIDRIVDIRYDAQIRSAQNRLFNNSNMVKVSTVKMPNNKIE